MTNEFENTHLWQCAFEAQDDRYGSIERLRSSFKVARSKTEKLVSLITGDLPEFTVHDITHLDALWDIGSEVCGDEFEFSPAEAYVFGLSVLLHDAGMTLAAYPGGFEDIKDLPNWRETLAYLLSEDGHEVTEAALANPPEHLKNKATQEVLRVNHSQKAEELATQAWTNTKFGGGEFIIDDTELRNFYGNVVGQIARSHWLGVSQLEAHLPGRIGVPAFLPGVGELDPVVVASLLRCADAAHLDARRAPNFKYVISRPSGLADLHWKFQTNLARPKRDNQELVFTSGAPFVREDAEAWWLFYEAATAVDTELQNVDAHLKQRDLRRFATKRVANVSSPEHMATLVRTSDWRPVKAQVHVSDPLALVKALGGEKLYGNEKFVPFRELIQNSIDAVRARNILQRRPIEDGKIDLRFVQGEDGTWTFSVLDNGIGMSPDVMTNNLLDFGTSYWKTRDSAEGGSSLWSSGFSPIGEFGIGFFSVFMIGKKVTVCSCRFDEALSSAQLLDLTHGDGAFPILREADSAELLRDRGTKVSAQSKRMIIIDEVDIGTIGWDSKWDYSYDTDRMESKDIRASELVSFLSLATYALDINVTLSISCPEKCIFDRQIAFSDYWKACSGTEFLLAMSGLGIQKPTKEEQIQFIDGLLQAGSDGHGYSGDENDAFDSIQKLGSLVTTIKNETGRVVGRAAIIPDARNQRRWAMRKTLNASVHLSIGGMVFRSHNELELLPVVGLFPGRVVSADRMKMTLDISESSFADWANTQVQVHSGTNDLRISAIVGWFGGDPGDLPFIKSVDGSSCEIMSLSQFSDAISAASHFHIVFSDTLGSDEFKQASEEIKKTEIGNERYFVLPEAEVSRAIFSDERVLSKFDMRSLLPRFRSDRTSVLDEIQGGMALFCVRKVLDNTFKDYEITPANYASDELFPLVRAKITRVR